jgi:hypothetical protein
MKNNMSRGFLDELVKNGFIEKFRDLNKLESFFAKKGVYFNIHYNHFYIEEAQDSIYDELKVRDFKQKPLTSLQIFFSKEVIKQLNLKHNKVWIKDIENMPKNYEEFFEMWSKGAYQKLDAQKGKTLLTYLKSKTEKNKLENILNIIPKSVKSQKNKI